MILKIIEKIKALISDVPPKSEFEVFKFTISKIFTLSESNIVEITKVLHNGTLLGTGQYSFDSVTNKIEILIALASGDLIEVNYTFSKYSNEELSGYIKAALVWISIYAHSKTDFELENGDIFPTPDNKTLDLISLISAILIKPNWSSYNMPNLKVSYPRKFSKEEKIEKLINKFYRGLGTFDILKIN